MHWNVGKVKITKIVELETVGSTRFILPLATNEEIQKLPWLIPHFATEEGRLKMSIHSLLVETPSRRIVVDTGLGNDKQGRNVPTWNNRNDPFLETMTAAGFPPDSIDTVLCTHLHVDHVGWNTKLVGGKWVPTFANARYVFGKTEYEHWRDHSDEPDKVAVFNDSVKPIADAGKADLVASDAKLCDEITLIPTPGHSPGHMSIHIKSDGEQGLLTGDVAHHPCQMAHLDWSSTADSDPVQSAVTRRELFSRFADTPTLVIGGHFNAGHIRRDGDAFKFIALSVMARSVHRSSADEMARRKRAYAHPALRGRQLNFPPRCSMKHPSNRNPKNPQGVMKMKLVRYGAKGQEKPGLIDKSGQLRDLSAHVKDLNGEAYAPASLAKLAALDTSKLPAVDGKPRLRRAGHRHLEIRRDRPQLCRPRQGDRQSDSARADLLPEGQHRAVAARTTRSRSRAARPSSTGKSKSPPSSAPAPNTSPRPTRSITSPAIASATTSPSAISRSSAAGNGPRASRTTPSARSARGSSPRTKSRTCRSCRCGSTSTASAARPDRPRP